MSAIRAERDYVIHEDFMKVSSLFSKQVFLCFVFSRKGFAHCISLLGSRLLGNWMRQRNLNLVRTTMLILEKNKIYCEILRAMDIYGSACFEPEIPRTSLSNHRVKHYGRRLSNGMYSNSNFNVRTCQTVKRCLIELFVQPGLYYCVSSVSYCRSVVLIYTSDTSFTLII
jgi:hypothetical protein